MDCNNYSFVNGSGESAIIVECSEGLSGYPVTFERCLNWFGDRFYFVSDLFGACGEFNFSGLDIESEKIAYKKAAAFYNDLVPDADMIPLF